MPMIRNHSLDILKIISIFGVVFIHASKLFGGNVGITTIISEIFRIAVPCFIIVWAYFFYGSYHKKAEIDRIKFLFKKFKEIFIVFFVWSLFYFILTAEFNNLSITSIITKYFLGYGWSGQYFFIILFQFIFLFKFIDKIYKSRIATILCTIVSIISFYFYSYQVEIVPDIIYKIGDKLFIFWLPYVFLGMWFRSNDNLFRVNSLLCLLLLVPVVIPMEFKYIDIIYSPYVLFSVLISSIIFSVFFFIKSIDVRNVFMQKTIGYIGSNTMTIFVANPLFVMIIARLQINLGEYYLMEYISPFLSTLLVTALCLILAKLIKLVRLDGILN